MICSLDGSGLLVYNLPRRTSTSLIEIPAEDQVFKLNTFTPKGDQGEISPYNVLTLLSKKVMTKQENISLGILFDLILKAKIISNVWSTVKWYVGLRSEKGHDATEYKSKPAEVDLHTPI